MNISKSGEKDVPWTTTNSRLILATYQSRDTDQYIHLQYIDQYYDIGNINININMESL